MAKPSSMSWSEIRGGSFDMKLSHLALFAGSVISTGFLVEGKNRLERFLEDFNENYEGDLLEYCLHRTVIVCPNCNNLYEVRNLDEQLNVDWACHVCGSQWTETPTHDMEKK